MSAWYLYYQHFFADLKDIFAAYIKSGDHVFDIGCGNKPYERHIRSITGCTQKQAYTGCDVVQSSLACADIICEATNIPAAAAQYDVVICTQVIEHVFEHAKVFGEAYRLLRSGGYFIVSSNLVWEVHEAPYDFYRFTRYGFEELLKRAGFVIKSGKANGGRYAAVGQVILHTMLPPKARTTAARIVYAAYRRTMYLAVNTIFSWLDRRDRSHPNYEKYTLNYIFVGQKP
jgi:SAM-dependent methyltransferase